MPTWIKNGAGYLDYNDGKRLIGYAQLEKKSPDWGSNGGRHHCRFILGNSFRFLSSLDECKTWLEKEYQLWVLKNL